MIKDYYILKKKYGERFARLCRELFPTLLEEQGLLSEKITSNFADNKFLYDDIVDNALKNNFKEFILSQVGNVESYTPTVSESPFVLMKKAGYTLYKCETDEEVDSFKKYWQPHEELCTFRDDERINENLIFFAVKDNADAIKRKDFTNPKRQDEYGTSVISLQFTKQKPNMLSIKNRYNHTVALCDATFSNDPENIIAGLTDAFVNEYDLDFFASNENLEIPNYVLANDRKLYKYNVEKDNIYYCDNKIIDEDRVVVAVDSSRWILLDEYVFDTKLKQVLTFNDYRKIQIIEEIGGDVFSEENMTKTSDAFIDSIGNFNNFKIEKKQDGKKIVFYIENGEDVVINIDNHNRIVGYKNHNVKEIDGEFLLHNTALKNLELPNVEKIDDYFMSYNTSMINLSLPKVKMIGDYFLHYNKVLRNINLPEVEIIGNEFMEQNEILSSINLPKVIEIGDYFLDDNIAMVDINLPNVEKIGDYFLSSNTDIESIDLPNVIEIGKDFLINNTILSNVNMPKVETIEEYFLGFNTSLNRLNLPHVKFIGQNCLYNNQVLSDLVLSAESIIEKYFLHNHKNRDILLQKSNNQLALGV